MLFCCNFYSVQVQAYKKSLVHKISTSFKKNAMQTLSHLSTLPYLSRPYPTLPNPTLPYPTLPYSTLPNPTLPIYAL